MESGAFVALWCVMGGAGMVLAVRFMAMATGYCIIRAWAGWAG